MGTFLGLVVGALGVAATIYYARKADKSNRARRRLEWADLQTASNDVARRIKRSCTPAAIVTPGLAGATFANLLASEFVGQPPVFVGVSVWKGKESSPVLSEDVFVIETKMWIVSIPKAPTRYAEGDILIVDDFAMSGDFLDELKRIFVEAGIEPERIKSASVAATRVAIKNHKAPDYYWWIAEDDDFYFPWGKAR